MRGLVLVWLCVLGVAFAAEKQEVIRTEYKGVPVYSTRQCVEFVRRFLKVVHNYSLPPLGAGEEGSGKYVFERVQKGLITGLVAYSNGESTAPQVDDVLCFTHPTKAGHVGIVSAVTAAEVHIVEQNWSATGWGTLSLRREQGRFFVTRGRSEYRVQGWCRLPALTPSSQSPVVLLLDQSASVARGGRERTMEVLKAYNRRILPGTPNMVVTFADQPTVIVPRRVGPLSSQGLNALASSLQFGGKTNIVGAFERILKECREWSAVRVILVTDGRQTVGRAQGVLPILIERKIAVYAIEIGVKPSQRLLQRIAEETGGIYFGHDGLTLDAAMRTIMQ